MEKRGKPFAKSRMVIDWVHGHHSYWDGSRYSYRTLCQCSTCNLAHRLNGEPDYEIAPHIIMCHAKVTRLDYSQEEALEASAGALQVYWRMVATELAREPFTMLFGT